MEVDAVVRAVAHAEEAAATRWCAGEESSPRESLRRLAQDMAQREGGSHELIASGLDRSSQILLLALCERYGLKAIRRKRQRQTTLVLVGPKTFLEEVLWPMYTRQVDAILAGHDRWLNRLLSSALAG